MRKKVQSSGNSFILIPSQQHPSHTFSSNSEDLFLKLCVSIVQYLWIQEFFFYKIDNKKKFYQKLSIYALICICIVFRIELFIFFVRRLMDVRHTTIDEFCILHSANIAVFYIFFCERTKSMWRKGTKSPDLFMSLIFRYAHYPLCNLCFSFSLPFGQEFFLLNNIYTLFCVCVSDTTMFMQFKHIYSGFGGWNIKIKREKERKE